jgi:hypothetical protein
MLGGLVEQLDDETIKGKFLTWSNSPDNRELAVDLLATILESLE